MFRTAIARLLRRPWGGTPYFDERKSAEIDNGVLVQQIRHHASMLQQLAEEIAALGANSETYESVKPVKISVSGEDYSPPDRTLGDMAVDDTLYALEVSNPSSQTVEKDGEQIVRNGLAMNVVGTANFQANTQRDHHTNDGESFTQYALLVDNQFVQVLLQINNAGKFQLGDFIAWENGVWYGGNTDTFKVKLQTASDTEKFLSLHLADLSTATYDATYDILVKPIITGGQLRFMIDSSGFSNFATGSNQGFGHLSGQGPNYIDLSTECSTA